MNNTKKIIILAKNILRRRVRFYQRKKERIITGNHCHFNELKRKKDHYESIKQNLIHIINDYQTDHFYEPIVKPTTYISNVEFLSNNGDWLGKVFGFNGQIYRGINAESINDFEMLWKTGIIQTLGELGVVPKTTISCYYSEDYPIILHHESVKTNTSKAWCFEMIKDACIFSCILRDVLMQFGYTLYDGHLNNVIFHNNMPMFIDIGSIVKDDGVRDGFSWELAFSGLYRLIFYLFGNNLLKHIQVYDEANNSIWITPWHYDNSLEEYYFYLKKFKAYGWLHNSFLVNVLVFKVFDCYDIKPEYIDVIFKYKRKNITIADNRNEKAIEAIKPYLEECGDCLGVNASSYLTLKELSNLVKSDYKVMVDDDEMANQLYEIERKSNGKIGVFLHNVMYPSDRNNLNNIMSDFVVAECVDEEISCVHDWKYDTLIANLEKVSKRYIYVSVDAKNEKLANVIKHRLNVIFDCCFGQNNKDKRYILGMVKE